MTESPGSAGQAGLIVALDQQNLDQAEHLAKRLSPQGVAFKVGLTLFAGHGPEALRRIGAYGKVFCDLKLHDIPQQVGTAAASIGGFGVWMLSVHASGGAPMIARAAQSLRALADPPVLAAVTVLTSLSAAEVAAIGQGDRTEDQVLRLADLATDAGAEAVICSPRELARLRRHLKPETLLICPGVRPAGAPQGDQARTMTPGEAAKEGADYIVVGRPITESQEPSEATRAVLDEMREA